MGLQERIDELMDNAKANEYEFVGWSALEIACDMITYSQEMEHKIPEDLVPHIQAWKAAQKRLNRGD